MMTAARVLQPRAARFRLVATVITQQEQARCSETIHKRFYRQCIVTEQLPDVLTDGGEATE